MSRAKPHPDEHVRTPVVGVITPPMPCHILPITYDPSSLNLQYLFHPLSADVLPPTSFTNKQFITLTG